MLHFWCSHEPCTMSARTSNSVHPHRTNSNVLCIYRTWDNLLLQTQTLSQLCNRKQAAFASVAILVYMTPALWMVELSLLSLYLGERLMGILHAASLLSFPTDCLCYWWWSLDVYLHWNGICCNFIIEFVSAVSFITVPPIIFVIIGLTTVLDEYVVYLRNDTGAIQTDAAGNDIISLWVLHATW